MKKGLLVIALFVVLVVLTSRINDQPKSTVSISISDSDKNQISQIVNKYYDALENQNFDVAFSYTYEGYAEADKFIDYKTRIDTLKYLYNYVYDNFELGVACMPEKVWQDSSSNEVLAYVPLYIKYKNMKGRALNEILSFSKINSQWKIVKIETSDVYIPYRVRNYKCNYHEQLFLPDNGSESGSTSQPDNLSQE